MKSSRRLSALLGATALTLTAGSHVFAKEAANPNATSTPIKHVVVIYGENVSFDHYFGTYPHATNPVGEPAFRAKKNTPTDIDTVENAGLLTNNPNYTNPLNGAGAANPFRLDVTQVATADQNHSYTPEQEAEDNGAADLFPLYTGSGTAGGAGAFGTTGQVMGYFDGNTLTAFWSYAQNFAMSDNARTDGYGPSTPGALEVISGQTNGMQIVLDTNGKNSYYVPDGQGGYTMINDVDPRKRRVRQHHQHIADVRKEHRRCSQRGPASPGAASWAASIYRPGTPTAQRVVRVRRHRPIPTSQKSITSRITRGSNTMCRRRIRHTLARLRSPRLVTPMNPEQRRLIQPTTSMTSTTSTRRSKLVTSRPCLT
ncbi:MAG: alkaline phosphatase family protein [Rhizomicrobium sp.]